MAEHDTNLSYRRSYDLPCEAQSQLRLRLDAAADYGRAKIAETASPCARDLCWYLIQLAKAEIEPERLARTVRTAEHLWLAALEVELLEGGAE